MDRGRMIRWLLRAAVSLVLIALLLWYADLEHAAGRLARLDLGWMLVALLIKGVGITAGVLRWRLLLGGLGLALGTARLYGAYLVGRFFGSFLPSTIGLDVYRTYYAAVRTRKVASCVAVTAVEKVAGLFSLGVLCLAALPFGSRMLPESVLWLIGCVTCVPVLAAALLLVYPDLFRHLAVFFSGRMGKLGQALAMASQAVARCGHMRGRLLVAMGLGLVVHGGTAAMFVATARAVGVDTPAGEILFVGPLAIAATLVPLSIAGIGVREGAYAFFLTTVGVDVETAGLLAFLGFLVGEIYSLGGGALWLATPASRPEDGTSLAQVLARAAGWLRAGRAAPEGGP
ncbi:MAG: flippase-like domain-containing protein [Deltaproteobacteria bacterium]|nr:flippase-like domain-containing protein [Deltaproteobacteria bacterium]